MRSRKEIETATKQLEVEVLNAFRYAHFATANSEDELINKMEAFKTFGALYGQYKALGWVLEEEESLTLQQEAAEKLDELLTTAAETGTKTQ